MIRGIFLEELISESSTFAVESLSSPGQVWARLLYCFGTLLLLLLLMLRKWVPNSFPFLQAVNMNMDAVTTLASCSLLLSLPLIRSICLDLCLIQMFVPLRLSGMSPFAATYHSLPSCRPSDGSWGACARHPRNCGGTSQRAGLDKSPEMEINNICQQKARKLIDLEELVRTITSNNYHIQQL